jgi:hypothetical protein
MARTLLIQPVAQLQLRARLKLLTSAMMGLAVSGFLIVQFHRPVPALLVKLLSTNAAMVPAMISLGIAQAWEFLVLQTSPSNVLQRLRVVR